MTMLNTLKKSRPAYALRWGIRGMWNRRVTAPKILRTPPCQILDDARCEVHMLACARDWIGSIWALKSFYIASGERFKLCVHDDGSLENTHFEALTSHFPGSKIIRRRDADKEILEELGAFPALKEFRRTNVFGPKLTDFLHFASAPKILVLDSDILFFRRPDALLKRMIDPNHSLCSFNRDFMDICFLSDEEISAHNLVRPISRINAGLALLHHDSMPYERLECLLKIPGIINAPPWLIEQQLVALCATEYGAELLPDEYTMFLGACPANRDLLSRHYFGGIRHLMYREGIPRLVKQGMLSAPHPSHA